jgi:hypothetical protein
VPKKLLLDQFHLNVYIPHRLSSADAEAMSRHLNSRRFRARMRRAVESLFRHERTLRRACLDLTG